LAGLISVALGVVFAIRPDIAAVTLIVSLEANFRSTFVMIGQNRQAAYQQAKSDHDFNTGEQEPHLNTELTKLIHQLTPEIHTEQLCQPAPARPPQRTHAGHLTTQIAASCAPRLLSYRHPRRPTATSDPSRTPV
jgi:hypothetical protein